MPEHLVAVVSGAGKGMGRAISLRLARDGYAVVGCSRTENDLKELSDEISRLGSESAMVVADVMERSGTKAPVNLALESYGHVDVLVNVVGGFAGAPLDPFETTDDDFERTVTFTLFSPWWTTTAVLPSMKARKSGRIISIGSGSARVAVGTAGYVAAKHGLAGMTKSLAAAGGQYGITVNCVCPAYTNTPRLQSSWPTKAAARGMSEIDVIREAERECVQNRILEPEEIAETVAFLASPSAFGITGQVISVDGGYRI